MGDTSPDVVADEATIDVCCFSKVERLFRDAAVEPTDPELRHSCTLIEGLASRSDDRRRVSRFRIVDTDRAHEQTLPSDANALSTEHHDPVPIYLSNATWRPAKATFREFG